MRVETVLMFTVSVDLLSYSSMIAGNANTIIKKTYLIAQIGFFFGNTGKVTCGC
jgi:hypothetical protein